jgi:hypothetical protein
MLGAVSTENHLVSRWRASGNVDPVINHDQVVCDPPLVVVHPLLHLIPERAQGQVSGDRASEVIEEREGGRRQGHHRRFSHQVMPGQCIDGDIGSQLAYPLVLRDGC